MAFLPVIIVFLLYFSGIPIAYALFASSLFYFGVLNTGSPTDLILQKFITSTQSFPLLAIPFFVMAGSIMNYAGISTKLMSFADVLTGHLPGGRHFLPDLFQRPLLSRASHIQLPRS